VSERDPHLEALAEITRLHAEIDRLQAEVDALRQAGSGARIWHVTDKGRQLLAELGPLADITDRDRDDP
jgi:hypothetical protein